MDLRHLWKSQEEMEKEEKLIKDKQIKKDKQEKAKSLLLNRITEDYILSSDVTNEEKNLFISMFAGYDSNFKEYVSGDKFEYDGDVYEVINTHTTEPSYKPNEIPALYKLFFQKTTSDGTNIIPKWQPPIGDTITYPTGALVIHKDKVWESSVDDNVWEPGVYGWVEYNE